MLKRKSLFHILLAFVLVFALVACGSDNEPMDGETDTEVNTDVTDEDEKDSDDMAGEMDDEQYLNQSIGSEPTTLDPHKGSDIYGNVVVNNIFEPLLRLREQGDKLEIEMAGAEDYEVSDDGLVYTFTLRDFEWEDGEKVTAEHYEYGVKRAVDPNTGSELAFLLEPIANFADVNSGDMDLDELGIQALDENTLEVTLSYPATYFPRLVPFRVMLPQRPDMIEQYGETYGSEAEHIIGCGPFKLENWVHNSELNLVKSDTYWDKESVILEEVNYLVRTDLTTNMQSLEAGELDVGATSDKEWQERLADIDNLSYDEFATPNIDYMPMNAEDDLMQNVKIRQAISAALDRDTINEQLYQGLRVSADGWVPPSITVSGIEYAELRGEGPLAKLVNEVEDPKALFEEGLEELGLDGNAEDITINFIMTTSDQNKSLGELIQAELQTKLGCNIEIEMMEWPILNSRVSEGDYQMAYLAWWADYDDPYAMLSLFTSFAEAVNTGWSDPEYDALVSKAAATEDPEEAAAIYAEAEEMLIENSPIAPLHNNVTNKYRYDYVKNRAVSDFDTTGAKYMYTEGRD